MKIKKLIIKNIGLIADETIEINQPLVLFLGDRKQGKTTILNCVRWGLGDGYPKDVIKHGEKTGSIDIIFEDDKKITRRFWFKKIKDSEEKGPITDVIELVNEMGLMSKQNVKTWLKEHVNPFQFNQDHFANMSGLDANRFLADQFGLDTADVDKRIKENEESTKTLNIEVKAFGEIDTTEIKEPETVKLKAERQEIKDKHNKTKDEITSRLAILHGKNITSNTKKRTELDALKETTRKNTNIFNEDQERHRKAIEKVNDCFDSAKNLIGQLNTALEITHDYSDIEIAINKLEPAKADKVYVDEVEKLEKPKFIDPELPDQKELTDHAATLDTTEIDQKISDGGADQVKYDIYIKNLEKQKLKNAKVIEKNTSIQKGKDLKAEKVKMLAGVDTGIKGLEFGENGYTYFKTSADMLATSELMKLNTELAKLFNSVIKIEVVDRGESLGFEGVGEYAARAKANNSTIFMSFVREDKPAKTPDHVGVFVVKDGTVI